MMDMMPKVIKRDGRHVEFDQTKIESAIRKAFIEVDGEISPHTKEISERIASYVAGFVEGSDRDIDIELIQDLVEEKLMQSERKDVAKAYIIYRNDRSRVRLSNSDLIRKVKEKIDASNVENQNANMDERSFGGRIGSVSNEVMKQIALDEYLSPMARKNHIENMIYVHDLDHYVVGDHNCLSLPLDDLLANGFKTRQVDIRPAQSVNTAFQLVAVCMQLQSLQQFGKKYSAE